MKDLQYSPVPIARHELKKEVYYPIRAKHSSHKKSLNDAENEQQFMISTPCLQKLLFGESLFSSSFTSTRP